MRGGSNQWTCARKSSKDNKLYETISPGEKIQTLLSDNRFTSSRGAPPRGEYLQGPFLNPASPSKPKLPPRGPPPPGTLRRKPPQPHSNKKTMEKLGKTAPQDTTSMKDDQLLSLRQDHVSSQPRSKLQTSQTNKKARVQPRNTEPQDTTRERIEKTLANRRKFISGEYSAEKDPKYNPDNPDS